MKFSTSMTMESAARKTDFATDIANGSALLWRLYLRGIDVGDRWEELGEHAEAHARDATNTFFNTNYMMALLATGRRDAADVLIAAMRDDTARHDPLASRAVDAGIGITQGLRAFHEGDYGRAVDLMLPVRYEHYLFGGSHVPTRRIRPNPRSLRHPIRP